MGGVLDKLWATGEPGRAAWLAALDEALADAASSTDGADADQRAFLLACAHRVARGGPMQLFQEALAEPHGSGPARAAEAWLAGRDAPTRHLRRLVRGRREPACLRTIEAHEGPVQTVCLHPRRPLVLTGGADGSVHVYLLGSGVQVRDWHTDGRMVCALAVHPDNRRVVVGASPYLEIWDLEDDRRVAQLASGLSHFAFLALSPDGEQAVVGNAQRAITFTLATGARVPRWAPLPPELRGLTVLDGEYAATTAGARLLDTWRLDNGEPGPAPPQADGEAPPAPLSLAHPDGVRAFTSSGDHRVSIWDLHTRELRAVLDDHDGPVRALGLSPDGKRLVTASDDGCVRIWDPQLARPAEEEAGRHAGSLLAVALLPDGDRACSICSAGLFKTWDVDAGVCISTTLPFWRVAPDHQLAAAVLQPESDALLLADNRGALRRVDATSGRGCWRMTAAGAPLVATAIDNAGSRAAVATRDALHLHDAHTGAQLATFAAAEGRPFDGPLAFAAPDRIVTACGDELRLYDAAGFPEEVIVRGAPASALATGQDGLLWAGDEDGNVHLFDLARGGHVRTFRAHPRRISALALSPDGGLLCTTSADRSLRVWTIGGRALAAWALDGVPTACGMGAAGRVAVGDASGRVLLLRLTP